MDFAFNPERRRSGDAAKSVTSALINPAFFGFERLFHKFRTNKSQSPRRLSDRQRPGPARFPQIVCAHSSTALFQPKRALFRKNIDGAGAHDPLLESRYRPMTASILAYGGWFLTGFISMSFWGWFFHALAHHKFQWARNLIGLRHLRRFRRFHYTYHHRLYSSRAGLRSNIYREGRRNCNDTFLPAAILVYAVPIGFVSWSEYLGLACGYTLYIWHTIYLHELYHMRNGHSRIQEYGWFKVMRRAHDVHHVTGRANYGGAPLGIVWDWLLGTYVLSASGRLAFASRERGGRSRQSPE
jgi:sterol desaturase/sphingolipid hydroxylase (fatty acid hydroxylase superfamily)